MSVKVKATLKVLSYVEKGLTLVDSDGNNQQEIKRPVIMSASEDGITSDSEIAASLGLSTDQIADLVHQKNNARELVVLIELAE